MNAKIIRCELRLPAEFCSLIDDWRRKEDEIPSRTVALIRLVEIGLEAAKETKQ